MLKKILSPTPFKIFYFVFAYVLSFALWWAYLLYAKNEAAFKEKIELNVIVYRQMNPSKDYMATPDYKNTLEKYKSQRVMIESEGCTLVLLLLWGFYLVRRAFRREMELAELQRNFLLSITHELRSPLSTVKVSLQTLQKRKLEPAQSEKLIANSLSDLNRLESLVNNILFAAKIEKDEPGFMNEEINVSELVQALADRFKDNAKCITIHTGILPGIFLETDVTGFTSLVINLVENAIKYSEPNTAIDVKLTLERGRVLFSVADQGIGISARDKKRVFEKFFRVGSEDTRRTHGTGLGLYIVKRFVEIYHGTISIEDNHPRGTVFKVALNQ